MVFGEAGSTIIAKNMSKNGDINPFFPGKKITGVFVYCRIRNFTKLTNILQNDIISLVNLVAKIVHSISD